MQTEMIYPVFGNSYDGARKISGKRTLAQAGKGEEGHYWLLQQSLTA